MKRQERLTSPDSPITLNVLIDESVLRRMTGSTEVMAAQMRHLIDIGQLPNVTIRVVPSTVGTYRGLMVGSFVLMEFPPHPKADLTMPPVVYVQGLTGDLYLEKPVELDQYRGACADIERLALNEDASRSLVLDIAKEYAP